MSQKLYCFGTAGYHPNDRRQTSSYFLPGLDIALDAGSGFYRTFPLLTQPEFHVLVSHAHLDHIIGLTFLWNAYQVHKSLECVHVWGESDKLDAVQKHVFSELVFPVMPKIEWHPIACNELWKIRDTTVMAFPLDHPGGSTGFRIDHAKHSLAYITDTTAEVASSYWHFASNVDLLVHECNFRAGESEFATKTGHSDLGRLMRCLQTHKVKRALLTHFNTIDDDLASDIARAKAEIPNLTTTIELANDLDVIEF